MLEITTELSKLLYHTLHMHHKAYNQEFFLERYTGILFAL